MDLSIVNYRTNEGVRPAIIAEGRKVLHVIALDAGGVKVRKVSKGEARYMAPLDYPIKRAARRMLAYGKHVGISKQAKAHLTTLTRRRVS